MLSAHGRYALPRAYLPTGKYGPLILLTQAFTMMQLSQIIIKDLRFYAFHGVYPQEREIGTTFKADIILDIDSSLKGFHTDKLSDTLNYEKIVETILNISTHHKYFLIEHLAQVLCEEMLKYNEVLAADVTIYKSVKQLTPDPQWIGVRRKMEK